jgi:hypothetical protein
MKPEWRKILETRGSLHEIVLPIDCDTAVPGDLNTVYELVREGIMVWIDVTTAPPPAKGLDKPDKVVCAWANCDVYQLTLKGIRLCNEHGIGHKQA